MEKEGKQNRSPEAMASQRDRNKSMLIGRRCLEVKVEWLSPGWEEGECCFHVAKPSNVGSEQLLLYLQFSISTFFKVFNHHIHG